MKKILLNDIKKVFYLCRITDYFTRPTAFARYFCDQKYPKVSPHRPALRVLCASRCDRHAHKLAARAAQTNERLLPLTPAMLDRSEGKRSGVVSHQVLFLEKSSVSNFPPLCDFRATEYRSRVRIKARICLSRFSGELYAPRTWRETQGTPKGWCGGARVLVTFTRKSNTAKGAGTPIKITARSDTRRT